ncbi:hypothetical protein J4E08_14985 [Sagittula sp. NFXS13]|uniref:Uncharacterized protein n=1 Tax=Sagittula marina TaxID=943940 RepID=A0A7W6DQR3_9RHOB|nr:hypothetical protein [Sagittula marina]MBB3985976.1 hypothetical protein [Sagittula marina]
MTTQLLLKYDHFDQSAFDADAEARGQAGLTLLQMWKEGSARWALFTVNDGQKARDWLSKESALSHPPAASHMLETL